MRIPLFGKKKKLTNKQEENGRTRKEHVTLPISIPQNIIDWFIDYKEWRKDQQSFPKGHKEKMLDKLDPIGRKWHLYKGWQNVAGSTWIFLKNGLVLVCHVNEEKPLVIKTCVLGKEYEKWGKQPQKANLGDKNYVYNWNNYEHLQID